MNIQNPTKHKILILAVKQKCIPDEQHKTSETQRQKKCKDIA